MERDDAIAQRWLLKKENQQLEARCHQLEQSVKEAQGAMELYSDSQTIAALEDELCRVKLDLARAKEDADDMRIAAAHAHRIAHLLV